MSCICCTAQSPSYSLSGCTLRLPYDSQSPACNACTMQCSAAPLGPTAASLVRDVATKLTMQRLHFVQIQEAANERAIDESSKYLATLKTVLFAEHPTDQTRDYAVAAGYEACKFDLPLLLAQKIVLLDFEARKDSAQVACSGWLECSCCGVSSAFMPAWCSRVGAGRYGLQTCAAGCIPDCCHVAASSCCTMPKLSTVPKLVLCNWPCIAALLQPAATWQSWTRARQPDCRSLGSWCGSIMAVTSQAWNMSPSTPMCCPPCSEGERSVDQHEVPSAHGLTLHMA